MACELLPVFNVLRESTYYPRNMLNAIMLTLRLPWASFNGIHVFFTQALRHSSQELTISHAHKNGQNNVLHINLV